MADNNKIQATTKEVGQKLKGMADEFGNKLDDHNKESLKDGPSGGAGVGSSSGAAGAAGASSNELARNAHGSGYKDGEKGKNHSNEHKDSDKDMKDNSNYEKDGMQGKGHSNEHNNSGKDMKDNAYPMKDNSNYEKDGMQGKGHSNERSNFDKDMNDSSNYEKDGMKRNGNSNEHSNSDKDMKDNSEHGMKDHYAMKDNYAPVAAMKDGDDEGEKSDYPVTLKDLYANGVAQGYLLASESESEGDESPKDYLAEKFKAKFLVTALEADSMSEVKEDCKDAVKEVLDKANNMIDHCLEHFVEKELNQDSEAHSKTLEKMDYEENNALLLKFFENANSVLEEIGIEGEDKNTLLEKVVGVSFEGSHHEGGDEGEDGEDIEIPGDWRRIPW